MGLRIKDRLELFVLINNKEVPFAPTNSLDFLHMSCSTRLAAPMIHMKIKDGAKWFAKEQVLADGVKIVVVIKVGEVTQRFPFRLNSFKEQLDVAPTYEIDGYYDNIEWWLSSTNSLLKGTSSDVIGRIATKCGLPTYFKGNTADAQVWSQRNMRFNEFAKFIAKHGYVSDQSCMQLGLDLSGALVYKNIAQKTESAAVFHVGKFDSSSLIATDFKIKNSSGLLNAISGYADELISASVKSSVITRFSTVPITKLTQKLMVNSDIYKTVENGRVLFAPIDCGNVHQNYHKARYQNNRIASTYSFGIELMTPEFSGLKLLDFLDFQSNQPGEKGDAPYSGTYIVTSRAVYVQGINYYEKIEGVRHGLNAAVGTQI